MPRPLLHERLLLAGVCLLILAAAAAAAAVGAVRAEPSAQPAEMPLELPASFTGRLPCADCPGVDWHLDLWPDGRFHLARRYVDREGSDDELGRWRLSPAADAILLLGADQAPWQLRIIDARTLRLLDRSGRPIESSLPYELRSDGTLSTTELSVAAGGEFRYMADAASLRECRTGYSYPVLMEGDYAALERAYLNAVAAAGEPLYARVEAAIVNRQAMEGEGAAQSLRIDRFVALQPDMRCERAMSEASLANTYWRLLRLGDQPVERASAQRESHIIFHENESRAAGVAGCNRFSGSYELAGSGLSFGPLMSTRMACPPPLDALERELFVVFDTTRAWRISGEILELLDEGGEVLAVYESVYLP